MYSTSASSTVISGVFTYDPGYGATASCESKITYIDGDEGVLLYRGYPIEQLAETLQLPGGVLPAAEWRTALCGRGGGLRAGRDAAHHAARTAPHFYNGFRRDAHPMAVMCGVVGALSAFYHDSLDVHDPESRRISAFRLIAKVPTIAAWAHKYAIGQPFIYPRNDLTYAENFLLYVPRGAGRGIQDQPGAVEGDGPDPDPARRP